MIRFRRLILTGVALLGVAIGTSIPLAFSANSVSTASGGVDQCPSGSTIALSPQSSSVVNWSCSAVASTTTTTQPPATTTTTAPTTTTTTTQPSSAGALLGLWNNGTSASQLGVTEQVVSDYAYGTNSTSYNASGAQAAKGKLLLLGVGALTTAQAVQIGTVLEQNGQSNAIIRPMWEMNQGGWFAQWNEKTYTAAQYKAEWITIVNGFRSVLGSHFRFDYNPTACNANVSGRQNFDSFAGTAYVDFIGIDVYDNNGSVAASQACITADAQFAQSQGIPWTIPEWGLYNSVDDPAFVHQIWLDSKLPTCYLQALFSGLSSGPGTPITNAPKSLAEYKADFAGK